MVYKVDVCALQQNMVIAESVQIPASPTPTPLLPDGHALSYTSIQLLKTHNIPYVFVQLSQPDRASNQHNSSSSLQSLSSDAIYAIKKKTNRQAFSKLQTLVVDDNFQIRSISKNMLEQINIRDIIQASDADIALAMMATAHFDLILCDYNLGRNKKTGQQFFEEVKINKILSPQTIFVMITAESASDMVMSVVEFEPDDYLIRPFNLMVLKQRIAKLIQHKSVFAPIETAFQNQSYKHALVLCEQALKNHPKMVFDLIKIKGDILQKMRDFKQAQQLYEKVLTTRNDIVWALLGLAKTHYLEGNYTTAKEILVNLVGNYSKYAPAYDWLAKVQLQQGDASAAQTTLKKVVNMSSHNICRQQAYAEAAYNNGDFHKAKKILLLAMELAKNSIHKDISMYILLAEVSWRLDSEDAAIAVMQNAHEIFNETSHTRLQLAIGQATVYQKMGQIAKAQARVSEAETIYAQEQEQVELNIALDLINIVALIEQEKAITYLQKLVGNYLDNDAAIKQIELFILNSSLSQTHNNVIEEARKSFSNAQTKGIKLLQTEQLQEAIDYFQALLTTYPLSKLVNINYLRAMIKMMQKNGKERHLVYRCESIFQTLKDQITQSKQLQALQAAYNTILSQEKI